MNHAITTKKQRDIGPEWLRIFAMILIILSHVAIHSNFVFDSICFNSVYLSVLSMGGKIGVNIFILISGYYSVKSHPTVDKAIRLMAQTVFYCVVLYFVSCAVGASDFRLKYIIYALTPFISNKGYWFITIYMLLYILTPFINGGLQQLTKKQHLCMIVLFMLVWAVLPRTYGAFFSEQSYGISELGWFVLAYSVGAYLRLYPIKLYNHRVAAFLLWTGTAVVMVSAKIIQQLGISVQGRTGIIINAVLNFITDSSLYGPVAFVFAILSMIVFQQLKLKPRKVVYMVSASTFGIYLIHDSEWLRNHIWNDLYKMSRFTDSSFLIIAVLIVMLITFIVCSIVDIMRKQFIEIPIFNSAVYQKTKKKCKKLSKAINNRLLSDDDLIGM